MPDLETLLATGATTLHDYAAPTGKSDKGSTG